MLTLENIVLILLKPLKQVRSDNDASEVGILGQLGTFWDNSEDFLTSLDLLDGFPSHFRPFSPIIGLDIF